MTGARTRIQKIADTTEFISASNGDPSLNRPTKVDNLRRLRDDPISERVDFSECRKTEVAEVTLSRLEFIEDEREDAKI